MPKLYSTYKKLICVIDKYELKYNMIHFNTVSNIYIPNVYLYQSIGWSYDMLWLHRVVVCPDVYPT